MPSLRSSGTAVTRLWCIDRLPSARGFPCRWLALGGEQDALAEEGQAGAAEHLALEHLGYYYPVRVSLQSVGPGAIPLPASFSIALDSRVIRDVTIIKAQLNYKAHDAGARLISHKRTSRLQENSWRTGVVLKAGDRLDLYLGVTVQGLTKDLPTIKHPAVTLINMGNHVTQRQTGRNGISRNDSKWA